MNTRMWCPNCQQFVVPQKKDNSRGWVLLILLLIAVFCFISGHWLYALGALVVDGIYLGVCLIIGLLEAVKSSHCPMCKETNLSANKPEEVL